MGRLAIVLSTLGVLAVLAGCQRGSGGTLPDAAPPPPPRATVDAADATSGTTVQTTVAAARDYTFRTLTIRLRPGWRVQGQGEDDPGQGVRVITGAPCRRSQYGMTDCPGFLLLGPERIREANELRPYDPERVWHPGTGVEGCPMDRDRLAEATPSRPKVAGFAQVGGHRAVYREWLVPCRAAQRGVVLPGNRVAATYTQRLWSLPRSQILIVDEWSVPGLPETLAGATWRP